MSNSGKHINICDPTVLPPKLQVYFKYNRYQYTVTKKHHSEPTNQSRFLIDTMSSLIATAKIIVHLNKVAQAHLPESVDLSNEKIFETENTSAIHFYTFLRWLRLKQG